MPRPYSPRAWVLGWLLALAAVVGLLWTCASSPADEPPAFLEFACDVPHDSARVYPQGRQEGLQPGDQVELTGICWRDGQVAACQELHLRVGGAPLPADGIGCDTIARWWQVPDRTGT